MILRETICAPDLTLERHAHGSCAFVFLLGGSYAETYDQDPLHCVPGSMKFRPSGAPHSTRCGREGAHYLSVELDRDWLHGRIPTDSPILRRPLRIMGGAVAAIGSRLRAELVHGDAFTPLVLESLALSLCAELVVAARQRAGTPPPPWLLEARRILEESSAAAVALSELAGRVGVHPAHLAATFRRHYGLSVGAFARRRRVERSQEVLMTSDLSLSEVALASGFSSQSHFTRLFKLHTGETPAQYRRSRHFSRARTRRR